MTESYVRQFDAATKNGSPDWLKALRQGAITRFQQVGFPTTKDEEWRFTPVTPIGQTQFAASAGSAAVDQKTIQSLCFGHDEWPRMVFIDGRFEPTLSRSADGLPGVQLRSLADALESEPGLIERHLARHADYESTAFAALNTALVHDGVVLQVSHGVELEQPIHLLFVSTKAAADVAMHPRILLLIGREARAQVIENYLTLAPGTRYWTNTVAEVVVDEGAWVEHSRIQRESEAAFHIGLTYVEQRRESHYRSFSMAMGGALARHDLQTRLAAPNTEALLYGLYIAHGEQLIDNHTTIYHDQPNCRSWEVYKGVLDGRSRGVFNGKILVQPEAQKTDAKQTNRALLLSDQAKVDTKPQLEIFADDVKCTHGATVGQLDEVSRFYLQSRGIPSESARRLLTYAFAAEVLSEVASEPVRDALDQVVHERLARVA